MHLALCGIQIIDLEKAQRLFVADWALNNHVSPDQLLKLAGVEKYNHNHLGPGPNGGQFAPKDSGSATMTLHDAISQDAASSTDISTDISAAVGRSGNLATRSMSSAGIVTANDALYPHEAIDSDPIGGLLLPAVGAYGAIEALGSEAATAIATRARVALAGLGTAVSGMGTAAAEKVEELYDSVNDTIEEWLGENSQSAKDTAVESLMKDQLSESQLQNLQRFNIKLPVKAGDTTIENLSDGNVAFRADVPADNIPGSFARYEKIIDKLGNTVKYTKTTFASDGSVIHVKEK